MSIITSQLISAAMLQDLLVDKNGLPLAGGVVTMYAPDMVTYKNWYYDAGTSGSPNYITLPNPMTLSAAGTIVDVNGNDVIPFYYPFVELSNTQTNPTISQLYYVTVYNAQGTLEFTRINFPSINGSGSTPSSTTIATRENYIINNRFWRNIGSLNAGTLSNSWTTQYNSSGTVYYATLAPDQHDGFSMPDLNYIKNQNGNSTETITFNVFPETNTPSLTGDVGPEYYINHTCTADTSGATLKAYQFPISLHLATLAAQTFSFTIQGQSISGTATVDISIYQFCGTGSASPTPVSKGTITFGSSWSKHTLLNKTFAGTEGLSLSATGDDAYYLQIEMPTGSTNAICNLNFTLPSIYLSALETDLPTNSFSTYDQIDSVVLTPRTGDIRTSLNSFRPFGWAAMNDGTIGNSSSNATSYKNVYAWPLFNLIWTLAAPYSASGAGTTNPIAQMYTSAGSAVGYGPNITSPTTALSDWNSNNQLSLTKSMGKVLLGSAPLSSLLPATPSLIGFSSVVTDSDSSGLLFTTDASNLLNLFVGNTVTFQNSGGALNSNITANTVYYVIPISSTTFKVATSFANALAGTAVAYGTVSSGTTTAYLQLSGSVEGEYAHTQLLTELVSHSHNTGVGGGFILTGGTSEIPSGAAANGQNVSDTGATGGGLPFNVTQPATFMNVFIKL